MTILDQVFNSLTRKFYANLLFFSVFFCILIYVVFWQFFPALDAFQAQMQKKYDTIHIQQMK